MEVTILGCRGSTPAVGEAFARYGGDTSSVAVSRPGEPPQLVLDAGTGLRNLGRLLGDDPFRGSILLTHLHWDHTHGLPFCRAVDRDDAEVDLYVPAQGGDPLELLSKAMGPPHFPITPSQLRGTWRFHSLDAGLADIEGFGVLAGDVCHTGGRTYGYRVSDGTSAMAYVPDFWQAEATAPPEEIVRGVDLLLHDAQHLAAEMGEKAFLGHSSVEYVVDVADRFDVASVVLFHHDPARTDDELDAILETARRRRSSVSVASAGRTYSTHGTVPEEPEGGR